MMADDVKGEVLETVWNYDRGTYTFTDAMDRLWKLAQRVADEERELNRVSPESMAE